MNRRTRRTMQGLAIAATVVATMPVLDAPAGAGGATVGAASAGDRLFPELGNGGYDAQSYDVSFDYRPGQATMTAAGAMTAVATQNLSGFSLDAAGQRIESVTVNGHQADFRTDHPILTDVVQVAVGAFKRTDRRGPYGLPLHGYLPGSLGHDAGLHHRRRARLRP